ncbi:hypothetical protein PLIIFM63780_009326 [Purpureocillium lilacinum]|uniref:GH16 domain-containing protein n=1 Tax=Purpureocillium lilacinum TaxID=33203 RepID=A0A2U3E5P4_PURLI|nr:hypothetical protein PCL_00718 [Purpureocillium lilacinum]GJN75468.1 hypothetical protein PLICBS_009567 [Purpureocillium lilacinum]GJN85752.1 hypothetical protein PLIIFM63780_009326 [Purpureocillium lilacinum]
MRQDAYTKPGEFPPQYDEVMFPPRGAPGNVRQARASMPWWNPRYWRKRVWAGIGVVLVVVIIVAVAVGVTQSKKNRYPDYSAITYSLSETYGGENFFDKFNYFTGYDPAQGFVHYVPAPEAKQRNLTYATPSTAVVKVDTAVGPDSVPNASTGRFSVRLESKKTYNSGLFLFDVKHTPYACGAWPALWLTDPSHWPDHGEIDIMESVNQGTDGNQMTLHTTGGCSMGGVKRKMAGKAADGNCDHAANKNAGCGVSGDDKTFGTAVNGAGGSVMAVEWRDAGIRMWQFARDAVPQDVAGKKPDPSTWGEAAADFPSTDCNIGSHFKNNSIIVNIDLCGDLVYGSWKQSGCPSNCTDLVANQPDLYKTAYWEFGSFEVYQPA